MWCASVHEVAPNSAAAVAGQVSRRRQPNFGRRASLIWFTPARKVAAARLRGLTLTQFSMLRYSLMLNIVLYCLFNFVTYILACGYYVKALNNWATLEWCICIVWWTVSCIYSVVLRSPSSWFFKSSVYQRDTSPPQKVPVRAYVIYLMTVCSQKEHPLCFL